MRLPRSLWHRLPLAGAVLAAGATTPAAPPVSLLAANAAASGWDTDPSKAGVALQIVNTGSAPADKVWVTSVAVRGGALATAYSALPIPLGNIAPQQGAILDLVITVPRTHATEYLLTISGTYHRSGTLRRFLLTRSVAPTTPPGPIRPESGILNTAPSPPATLPAPPGSGRPPGFGPNAGTPMLIPPGPPRQLSPPNSGGTGSPTQQH